MSRTSAASLIALWIVVATSTVLRGGGPGAPIIPGLSPTPTFSVSTVPSNGDLNPYGVAFVPVGFPNAGLLAPGDILVSNFNASSNLQGTGSTIVRIDPNGGQMVFFQGSSGLGLTTALGVLRAGFVLVGNVPTTTPKATCAEAPSGEERGVELGSLLILDQQGHLAASLKNRQFLDGPWDLTIHDSGTTAQVFVSNVLGATVTRLDLRINPGGQVAVVQATQIASGYARRCDPAALVVGPTGLALDPKSDTLYVASTGDNAIYAVPNAMTATTDQGTGAVLIQDVHLHGPLALAQAPNGDLITAQGDAVNPDPKQPSEIVEYTAAGTFVAQRPINAALGSAFGLALGSSGGSLRFAAVDDALNVLDIWIVSTQ